MARHYGTVRISPAENIDMSLSVDINYNLPSSTRAINMLLAKVHGEAFQTEVIMLDHEKVLTPTLEKPLYKSTIALVTDGGLVPLGNPDNLPSTNSDSFYEYSLQGLERLSPENYEISHQGYNHAAVLEDPNRLLPVDAARQIEREGKIGELLNVFYSTTGVMTSEANSKKIGQKIALSLVESRVNGVILTSVCGTSTRCGSIIAMEIEKQNIPVVQVTSLTKIAEGLGANRILRGKDVCHVLGAPDLSHEKELEYRYNMVCKALFMLETCPPQNESMIWR